MFACSWMKTKLFVVLQSGGILGNRWTKTNFPVEHATGNFSLETLNFRDVWSLNGTFFWRCPKWKAEICWVTQLFSAIDESLFVVTRLVHASAVSYLFELRSARFPFEISKCLIIDQVTQNGKVYILSVRGCSERTAERKREMWKIIYEIFFCRKDLGQGRIRNSKSSRTSLLNIPF